MQADNPTTEMPITETPDAATTHELSIHEQLEQALFDVHVALNAAAYLADRHADADLSLDIGTALTGIKERYTDITQMLAQYAAANAPLPSDIEEV